MTPATEGPGLRVLLVDDNASVLKSMARLVRALGHDPHVAVSGHDAVDAAERLQPRLVLLDLTLPDVNGCDVARAIRATAWGKTTTLVAVSGWGRAADRQRAFDAGFDQYVTKPIEVDTLDGLLRNANATARA